MTFHKQAGCCLGCQRECRQVLTRYETGPMAGYPRRLGDVTPEGTTVRFLLLDGSTTDLTFCVDCANRIGPADYTAIWTAQLDYTALVWAQNRSKWADLERWTREQRADLAHLMARPILAKWAGVTAVDDLARETVDPRVKV